MLDEPPPPAWPAPPLVSSPTCRVVLEHAAASMSPMSAVVPVTIRIRQGYSTRPGTTSERTPCTPTSPGVRRTRRLRCGCGTRRGFRCFHQPGCSRWPWRMRLQVSVDGCASLRPFGPSRETAEHSHFYHIVATHPGTLRTGGSAPCDRWRWVCRQHANHVRLTSWGKAYRSTFRPLRKISDATVVRYARAKSSCFVHLRAKLTHTRRNLR